MTSKLPLQIFLLISIIFALFHTISVKAAKIKAKEQSAKDSGEPEIFLRRQRDLAKAENGGTGIDQKEDEAMECTIRVKKVENVKGKCVKLKGGFGGCKTEQYLDPTSEDCNED